MLIVGSNDKMITSTKNMLNSRFDMKDLGLADVILVIKLKKTSYGLILSQSHYIDNILRKFDKDISGILGKLNLNIKLCGQLNELEKLRNEAYESAGIYKDRTKRWYDQKILIKEFKEGESI